MILSGHQPNYWPYPGLVGKVLMSDKFIFVTKVQFDKKSWQNRNRIRVKDGWIWLTVPVLTKGKFDQNICDVEVNNEDANWMEKHYKSIELNYKKAPYFKLYRDFLADLYNREWKLLSDLDIYIMKFLLNELDIKTEILYDKDYNFEDKKTEFLVDMCKKTGCDTYLSNKGSQAYVDLDVFRNKGTNHIYIDYFGKEYRQQYYGFEPNLSILDMLLNCGRELTREILADKNNYKFSELNKTID